MGDSNKSMIQNAFDIHDRATTASRIGRVRQKVVDSKDGLENDAKLVSELDLEVGVLPGLPFRVKGTVVTTASLRAVSDDTWETRIIGTSVKGSNVPIFNQFLDDLNLVIPFNSLYEQITGSVPVVSLKACA
jgi:hypothetical protein